jgi:hypothetical protein
MSFSEDKLIDQITVVEHGIVLYREATRTMSDGKVISQKFHRTSLTPGQDLTGHPEQVQAVARAAWTPEVIAAYQVFTAPREGAN